MVEFYWYTNSKILTSFLGIIEVSSLAIFAFTSLIITVNILAPVLAKYNNKNLQKIITLFISFFFLAQPSQVKQIFNKT